ncbi:uncharacterized protein [Diadema antillarum]|uniref:uncharacterized protein n=1 Tax=Diadema antillarum TaxID=105358 RepID=UPI003A8A8035
MSRTPIGELPAESLQLPAEYLVDGEQWLRFNVGGVMLETTRATVDKLHSSFFSLLLDSSGDDVRAPVDGVYRIDRDPQALHVFFNYGRYGKIVVVPEHVSESFLIHEHKFYGMSDALLDAIKKYFVERSAAPSTIQLERVTITEMAMDKRYLHHNVYGLIRGTQLCCFTNVPGKGVCYQDVGRWFAYEKPRDKYPALFRTSCSRCSHTVCLADDALIGLEGWCHKCSLCLRCQDILCNDPDVREDKARNVDEVNSKGNRVVRKTASAIFVSEVAPVALSPELSSEEDSDVEDEQTDQGLVGKVKDPLAEMMLKNRRTGVEGLASRRFSLLPSDVDQSKFIEPSGKMRLPQIPNGAATKAKVSKEARRTRRFTEPAALNIDQFAQFLKGGNW